MGEEGDEPIDDEDEEQLVKPLKTQMCPDMLDKSKGRCKNRDKCKFAHDVLQIQLVKPKQKIKNLKAVISNQKTQSN